MSHEPRRILRGQLTASGSSSPGHHAAIELQWVPAAARDSRRIVAGGSARWARGRAAAGSSRQRTSGEGGDQQDRGAQLLLTNINFVQRRLLLAKEQLVPCPTPELWPIEPHNSMNICIIMGLFGCYYCKLWL